ncbi:MAG: hypothetical protein GY808_00330 [Gammaproteobacteria bacterium]|nr:hypothetical protein [Gammaproteobacteria bacterium]
MEPVFQKVNTNLNEANLIGVNLRRTDFI